MISSKKIVLISVILVVISLGLTIYMMLAPHSTQQGSTGTVVYGEGHSVTYTQDDYYSNYSENGIAKITLSGETAACKSTNAEIDGSIVTIRGGGTYVVSGELTDGRIVVDSDDGAEVRLVLNGAAIHSSDGAAIYVKQAKKTVISLAEGTENHLSDSESYNDELTRDGVSATLYSKDDLCINGNGFLSINAVHEDGIKANDGFKITEGSLKINAADEGINANDYAAILAAGVDIISGGDAIRCENESPDWGFVALDAANINIESSGDGIYASSALYMTDIKASITTGGGSETIELSERGPFDGRGWSGFEEDTSAVSTKALKAGNNIVIKSGEMTLDSADDSIHSDRDLSIEKGSFEVSSGDDAVHAELNAALNPDKLNITKCREGIEAAYINIHGGDISIVSADDGINAVGENSSAGFGMPMTMYKENLAPEDIYLTINGGTVYIECGGDGVDSNGGAVINNGNLRVFGPENNGNSSLDFQYGFVINGGNIVAAGSSGMAELPHDSSGQNSIVYYLNQSYNAGTDIILKDANGNEILSARSTKKFDWVCVSSTDIKSGSTYTLNIGQEEYSIRVTSTITSSGRTGRRGW